MTNQLIKFHAATHSDPSRTIINSKPYISSTCRTQGCNLLLVQIRMPPIYHPHVADALMKIYQKRFIYIFFFKWGNKMQTFQAPNRQKILIFPCFLLLFLSIPLFPFSSLHL